MTGSPMAAVMIVIAATGGLAIMLGLVLLASRRPYFRHSHPDSLPGKVRGGVHLGDPRSQGPPEDEEVLAQTGEASSPPAAGPARQEAGTGARGS
jgi:hypothetical protein